MLGVTLRDVSMLCVVTIGVCSFVLLTGSTESSRLEVTRTVDANYRSSYDILVRPQGSQTNTEAATGTVRPNYLSGIYGGISRREVAQIRDVPGIEVAAPIAMIGQVFRNVPVPLDVTAQVKRGGESLFRYSSAGSNSAGLNRFDGPHGYTYFGRGVSLDRDADELPTVRRVGGRKVPVCTGDPTGRGSPFTEDARWFAECWDLSKGWAGESWPQGRGRFVIQVPVRFPVTVAAIDPVAEAALTGLDKAMVSGDFLSSDAGPVRSRSGAAKPSVPVLSSTRYYAQEVMQVKIDQLGPLTIRELERGLSRRQARELVLQAPSMRSRTEKISLNKTLTGNVIEGDIFPRGFYEAGPVDYVSTPGSAVLDAVPKPPQPDAWDSFLYEGEPNAPVPWSASGPGFRDLNSAPALPAAINEVPYLSVQGTFDPELLLQGTSLGEVPLETYQSPAVKAGDARTRELLGGEGLSPGSNPAGYLQNPPLMLTTLKSLPAITGFGLYKWADQRGKSDRPISVVRIRVAGVTGADELSRERVRVVAEAIKTRTGLDVDITVGSSPKPTTIGLSTDTDTLTIEEMWVEKGVGDRVVNAIDQKSLGLFILVLLTTAMSVGISANASVRARQRELAVLACLGWRPSTLYRSVFGRLLAIGILAGLIGTATSWPLGAVFNVPMSPARAAFAVPAAATLMLLVGIWPALTAARSTPAATIRSVARPPRNPKPLKGPASLGLAGLLRKPSRPITAILALAIGVAAVVLLLGITIGFRGTIVGNLLGDAVALQVKTADLIAGALLCIIGLIAVLDVLILDVKEQASAYASLQASGWRDNAIVRLIMTQAVIIAVLGATTGTLLGLAILNTLVDLSPTLLTIAGASTITWILIGIIISIAPAWLAIHLNTARILAEEDL